MYKIKLVNLNGSDLQIDFWLVSIENGKCIVTDNEKKATIFVDDTLDDLSVHDHIRVLESNHGYKGLAIPYITKQFDEEFLELLNRIRNHVESMGEYNATPRIDFRNINQEGFSIMGDNGNGGTKLLYRVTIEKLI